MRGADQSFGSRNRYFHQSKIIVEGVFNNVFVTGKSGLMPGTMGLNAGSVTPEESPGKRIGTGYYFWTASLISALVPLRELRATPGLS